MTPTKSLEVSNDEPKNGRQAEVSCTCLVLCILCFLNNTIETSVVIVQDLPSPYCTPLSLVTLYCLEILFSLLLAGHLFPILSVVFFKCTGSGTKNSL